MAAWVAWGVYRTRPAASLPRELLYSSPWKRGHEKPFSGQETMVYASLMFSELVPGFKPNWLREYRSETHRLKREAGSIQRDKFR